MRVPAGIALLPPAASPSPPVHALPICSCSCAQTAPLTALDLYLPCRCLSRISR